MSKVWLAEWRKMKHEVPATDFRDGELGNLAGKSVLAGFLNKMSLASFIHVEWSGRCGWI